MVTTFDHADHAAGSGQPARSVPITVEPLTVELLTVEPFTVEPPTGATEARVGTNGLTRRLQFGAAQAPLAAAT